MKFPLDIEVFLFVISPPDLIQFCKPPGSIEMFSNPKYLNKNQARADDNNGELS